MPPLTQLFPFHTQAIQYTFIDPQGKFKGIRQMDTHLCILMLLYLLVFKKTEKNKEIEGPA